MDLALMLMGDPGLPRSVRSMGGRFIHKGDDAEVPDVLNCAWDFKDFVMTLDMSQYPRYMEKSTDAIRRKTLVSDWMENSTRIEIYGQDLFMINQLIPQPQPAGSSTPCSPPWPSGNAKKSPTAWPPQCRFGPSWANRWVASRLSATSGRITSSSRTRFTPPFAGSSMNFFCSTSARKRWPGCSTKPATARKTTSYSPT